MKKSTQGIITGLLLFSSCIICKISVASKAEGWQATIGAGLLMNPAFNGSNDYQLSLLPYLKFNYSDVFFASIHEGVGFNLINNKDWTAGPIMRYQFSRKEDDGTSPFRVLGNDTNALQGIGNIDGTFETGAFINYKFEPFDMELEIRKGFGGHEGWISNLQLSYSKMLFPYGKRTILSIGPKTTWVSDNYNQTYFGINTKQSMQSGLPSFSANRGVLSYGVSMSGIVSLANQWTMVIFINYDRLTGDAAQSPLVKVRGDKNQFTNGLFLAYQLG